MPMKILYYGVILLATLGIPYGYLIATLQQVNGLNPYLTHHAVNEIHTLMSTLRLSLKVRILGSSR